MADANTIADKLFDEGCQLYRESEKYAEAEQKFRQAVDLEPKNAKFIAWLAIAVLQDDDCLEEAVELARKALDAGPDGEDACWVLGRAAEIEGKSEEAIRWYQRASKADPTARGPYRNTYRLHANADRWDMAFPCFLRWRAPDLSILETEALRWLKLTETAWENSNYDEVYQYAARILEEDPDSWLGLCYKSLAAAHVSTPNQVRLQELSNGLRRVFAEYHGDTDDIDWLSTLGAYGTIGFLEWLLGGYATQQEEYVGLHSRPTRDTTVRTNWGEALGQGLVNGMNQVAEEKRQRQAAAQQLGARFTRDFQEPIVSAFETCWDLAQPEYTATNICSSATRVTHASSLSWASKKAYRDRISALLTKIGTKYPDKVEKVPELEEENSGNGGCSPCFVATAVMGDFDDPSVLILREYRDRILLRSGVGRLFVQVYYRLSPPLANWISRSDRRRLFFYRVLIAPLVDIAAVRLRRPQ